MTYYPAMSEWAFERWDLFLARVGVCVVKGSLIGVLIQMVLWVVLRGTVRWGCENGQRMQNDGGGRRGRGRSRLSPSPHRGQRWLFDFVNPTSGQASTLSGMLLTW